MSRADARAVSRGVVVMLLARGSRRKRRPAVRQAQCRRSGQPAEEPECRRERRGVSPARQSCCMRARARAGIRGAGRGTAGSGAASPGIIQRGRRDGPRGWGARWPAQGGRALRMMVRMPHGARRGQGRARATRPSRPRAGRKPGRKKKGGVRAPAAPEHKRSPRVNAEGGEQRAARARAALRGTPQQARIRHGWQQGTATRGASTAAAPRDPTHQPAFRAGLGNNGDCSGARWA